MSKELRKAKNDIIAGVISVLFAVFYFLETFNFALVQNTNTVNAAFFPRIIACMVAAFASIMLLRGYLALRRIPREMRDTPEEEKRARRADLFRIAQVFLVLFAAAATFKKLGFILTMPWMMFLLFVILERKGNRRYKLYLLISCVAPVLLFVLFYYGFSSLLPMGILKPFISRFL